MSSVRLRARVLLADYLVPVGVALVAVAAVGGWLAYGAAAHPPTETETRVVSAWSTTGEFDHRATVVEDNPLYAVGTTLSNRSVYFRTVSPTVAGAFRYGYDAAGDGNVSATVRATLVVEEVATTADPGAEPTVLWRTTRDLGRRRATGLAPGETVTLPFAVNATRVARRTEAVQAELGAGIGRTRTRVVVEVRLRGRVDGRPVANETSYALALSVGRSAVRVDDPGAVTARHRRTRRVTVTGEPSRVRVAGGALLSAVAAAALLGLAVARWRGVLAPAPAERAAVEHRRARRELDEWITAGRLPPAVRSWPRVEVDSLRGLVDAAIDSDARVVEDGDEYAVPTGGLLYVYEAPDGVRDGVTGEPSHGRDRTPDDPSAAAGPAGTTPHGDGWPDRLRRRVVGVLGAAGWLSLEDDRKDGGETGKSTADGGRPGGETDDSPEAAATRGGDGESTGDGGGSDSGDGGGS